jgi:hypothetical protein
LSKLNNWTLSAGGTHPIGQRVYTGRPQVKIITRVDPIILEIDINLWIDSLALPESNLTKYTYLGIDYQTAVSSPNTITYSALISYEIWIPE